MIGHVAQTVNRSGRLVLFVATFVAVTLPACGREGNAQTPDVSQVAAETLGVEASGMANIVGDWQGTLEDTDRSVRVVLRITKTDKDWSAKVYTVGQSTRPVNASSVTFDGSILKCSVDAMGGSYQGTLSADGNSIVGGWKQGRKPQPLTLTRATKETAWEIPALASTPGAMAADADPSFGVATIKPNPNKSGATSMQGLDVNGRTFTMRNSSLGDLIAFAYSVQAKQIVGGPAWMTKDRYDIDGLPDQDGIPNANQLRIMVRKLLADRFQLTLHHEKKELSAYVLAIGKNGPKLVPTQLNGPMPGFDRRVSAGGLTLKMTNATLTDFTDFLQMLVLDRPVVDRTGIAGRFDYKVVFTPDNSEFGGSPPRLPPQTDMVESSPGLLDAVQQQLGLKLTSEKTPVDVIAIDRVEKPSAN